MRKGNALQQVSGPQKILEKKQKVESANRNSIAALPKKKGFKTHI